MIGPPPPGAAEAEAPAALRCAARASCCLRADSIACACAAVHMYTHSSSNNHSQTSTHRRTVQTTVPYVATYQLGLTRLLPALWQLLRGLLLRSLGLAVDSEPAAAPSSAVPLRDQ